MTHLIDAITHLIAHLGYAGVLLLMTLESACIPVPSEAIMPFAGSQISHSTGSFHPNLHMLAFTGALGNLIGSVIAYGVGAIGGRPFLEKYGRYVLIRRRDINKSDHYFQKYGEITVLVSRMLPVIRTFISLPAGIARMNFARFCVYTFIGALPFCYLLTWAGVKLGQHWKGVSVWLHQADFAISAALIIPFALWLRHHLRPEPEEVAVGGPEASPAGTKPVRDS